MRDIKEIENRYERTRSAQGKVNLFKKRYLIVLILLIAIVSNPSKEKYKRKIVETLNTSMGVNEYLAENNSNISNDILLDQIIESYMHYSNYLFFSTISVDHEGSSRIVGAGFFGFIYIPDQLKNYLLSTN